MRRKLVLSVALTLFLTVAAAGMLVSTSMAGATAEEAKAMTDDAVAYFNANGKEKAIEAFCNHQGQFVKGDLYVNMYDLSGVCIAHGVNPKLIANLIDLKDADGKLFIQEIVEKAKNRRRMGRLSMDQSGY